MKSSGKNSAKNQAKTQEASPRPASRTLMTRPGTQGVLVLAKSSSRAETVVLGRLVEQGTIS